MKSLNKWFIVVVAGFGLSWAAGPGSNLRAAEESQQSQDTGDQTAVSPSHDQSMPLTAELASGPLSQETRIKSNTQLRETILNRKAHKAKARINLDQKITRLRAEAGEDSAGEEAEKTLSRMELRAELRRQLIERYFMKDKADLLLEQKIALLNLQEPPQQAAEQEEPPATEPPAKEETVPAPELATAQPFEPQEPQGLEDQLRELNKLYRADQITPQEYHEQRAKLLRQR